MKSIAIYYFSGTGNTEIVTKMFEEEFFRNNYNVDIVRIEDVLKNKQTINIREYDLIGIGCQVIGYGIPNIVRQFIKHLPKGNAKRVFIYRTAGGIAPINYNASKSMMRKLLRKGYNVFYERIFAISSNWIVRFDDTIVRQLYAATGKKVKIACNEVINDKVRLLKPDIWMKLLMEIATPVFSLMFPLVGKDFKINASCNHCGICITNCPVCNIYEKKEK